MCKNELFQSLEMKNELFKIQGRKTNFMQSLGTKSRKQYFRLFVLIKKILKYVNHYYYFLNLMHMKWKSS